MIAVTVKKAAGRYISFRSEGHAGYADEGYDIICAAVSALTVSTVNSLEAFTSDRITVKEHDGFVDLRFPPEQSDEARLLMDSLVLGLTGIEESYGSEYLKVDVREVT
ncbi:MAG: ribosomal-processing cysteine protease Prp [Blautia sp.]|nr:ribosomal-processing cysteine protease Prp [Blautia sp.]